MKTDPARAVLKSTIEVAMHTATDEADFKKQLMEQGINTVVRGNDEGRIYGMTFIDHESRTVWHVSALGKNLSTNVFNDWWNEQAEAQHQEAEKTNTQNQSSITGNTVEKEEAHALFNFLNKEQPTDDLWIDGLGGLLPEAQGEDYEEQEFANRMKKKKKRKRHGRQQ